MPGDREGTSKPALFAENSDLVFRAFVGRGSMGAVYRAFAKEKNREVAVKTIPDRTPEQVMGLKEEFRVLAGIVHPNLVHLIELVTKADACYFTMEFVEGLDFVEHIRGVTREDSRDAMLSRFHAAAPQLVRGLAALHEAKRCHRDIKPANVRIDSDGRVVILDFDLALVIGEVGVSKHTPGEVSGTPAYMAPEQLWGTEPLVATDWYAVGVMFHEALTGRLPFGDPLAPLGGSPREEIELREWDTSLPAELAVLVAALLHPEPSARPEAAEILERLATARAQHQLPRARHLPPEHGDFVGRTRELTELRRILLERHRTRVAEIHGESGIGKTELVRHFLKEVGDESDALILTGRCHPQESVAFKALDAIMDSLSRYLLRLDGSTRDELRPQHAPALARLFPVLEWLPKPDPAGRDEKLDPMEALRRGIGAQRELLGEIARRGPLVLWIDDAQWSDADSARLIRELLRPPSAPSLMLILSHRSEDRENVDLLHTISELASETSALSFENLALEPLAAAESLKLAQRLCPPDLTSRSQLERLVAESGGSPFLLTGMARHIATRAAADPAAKPEDLRLGDVIASRLSELPEPERHILEIVSVSGRLTERGLALEAAGLDEGGSPLVERLESARLVRSASIDDRSHVEIYHDRIREAVISRLSPSELSARHRELATALETSGKADAEVLAHHFHGASELSRAADYAKRAAKRAVEALAFARGAKLYRDALDWGSWSGPEEGDLLADEGDALTKAGRLIEAGRRFREAAENAPRLKALERRQQAAQHLVSGGQLDLGIEVLQALLEELGLRYPRTPRRALLAAFAWLSEAVLRTFDPRGPVENLDEEERIRIDTCFGCGHHLVDTDAPRGVYFSVVSLVRALRARDPERMALSLCVVGGSISVVGGRLLGHIGERMMRQADAIAGRIASPDVWGTIDISKGQVLMLAGRCGEALTRSDAGVKRLTEECQGHALECNVGRAMALRALEELGRMEEVSKRGQELRDAAATVGDRYAETAASQVLAIALIACGDVAGARELARHGLELWTRRDFHIQHFYWARIQVLCDLYEDHPEAGWEVLRKVEPALRRSELLRIALTRTDALSLRGQLAVASASHQSARREKLLRVCERTVRQLEREKRADAALHAHLLRGGIAALRGKGERAVAHLEEAIRIGDEAEMSLRAACARLRRAELFEDYDSIEQARQKMIACGVQSPDRWAAIYAPGYTGSG